MIQYHRWMAAGTHNKTMNPMPPGAHQPRTQNARERYKQPTRKQSAEKNKNTSARKNNYNLTKRLSLSCTKGRHPDDDRRAASAATEALAGGAVTTATQTRNRLPQPQQRHQPKQRHNQQQLPVEPDHSNLCHARALRAGEANHRKLQTEHPHQHAQDIQIHNSRSPATCQNYMAVRPLPRGMSWLPQHHTTTSPEEMQNSTARASQLQRTGAGYQIQSRTYAQQDAAAGTNMKTAAINASRPKTAKLHQAPQR